MEENYIVYMHINKLNGMKYVGLTSCEKPNDRWRNGNGYNNKQYFYYAIQKYGWDNFEHIIIKTGLIKEEAEHMERCLIAKYNTTDKRYGYNISNGGFSNGKHSEETKEKMRKARALIPPRKQSEETRKKISKATSGENNPFYGKHHTEEAKQKIGSNLKGKYTRGNCKHSRPVIQIDKNTNDIIQVFECIKDAEETTGVANPNITMCCKGKLKSAGGFRWMYLSEYEGRVA